jgi:hypothetical protein
MESTTSLVFCDQRILKRGEARRILKRAKGGWPGFVATRHHLVPTPATEISPSKRMEVDTDFMGPVLISPEELAEHHRFRIGSEYHDLVVKPQNVDLREAMAGALRRPELSDETAFFEWYYSLVAHAYEDGER